MSELDFLIIGAQKSGTTSLRALLNNNPEKFFLANQELHFWDQEGQYANGKGLPKYLKNFERALPHQLVGEKTPRYLFSNSAPKRLVKHFPDVKLVAILRNPVDRAYSAYWHGRRVGAIPSSRSFTQAIHESEKYEKLLYGGLVKRGYYAEQLETWMQYFPRKQFHILQFEKMVENPTFHGAKLINYLEGSQSDEVPTLNLHLPKRNVARRSKNQLLSKAIHRATQFAPLRGMRSKLMKNNLEEFQAPEMHPEDREFLTQAYKEDAKVLEALLEQEFDWFR